MKTKIDKFYKTFQKMFEGLNEKYDEVKSALDNKTSVDLFKRLNLWVNNLNKNELMLNKTKLLGKLKTKGWIC